MKKEGTRALLVSFLLAAAALAGAISAIFVPTAGSMIILAASACVALAAVIASFFAFGGKGLGAPFAALATSMLVLAGTVSGIAAVSIKSVVDAVGRELE